ncbi:MAG: hypothetical protein ABSE57_32685 [Bryobacteraceae bacterium]
MSRQTLRALPGNAVTVALELLDYDRGNDEAQELFADKFFNYAYY